MIAAFDFDNTIIQVNSDTYIDKLVKNSIATFPSHVEQTYNTHGWTARMQAVFDLMHSEFNVTETDLVKCLKEIEVDESMKKLLRVLKEKNYELVIISDANTIFIEVILKQNGLNDLFDLEKRVYTNKSFFDEKGRLNVVPFNEGYNQDGQPFNCETNICTRNICKG